MAKLIAWFKDIDSNNSHEVGESLAKLGELYSSNFPVNLGFVITTSAFDEFSNANGLCKKLADITSQARLNDSNSILEASKRATELIMNATVPAYVQDRVLSAYHNLETGGERFAALNSTAYAMISAGRARTPQVQITSSLCSEATRGYSFGGTRKTISNIQGDEALVHALKRAWSALYEPQAIYYFKKHGFHEGSIAVCVQKMVDEEQSGIAFSTNPLTQEKEVVVEAIWGWARPLEEGTITPDSYTVGPEHLQVVERKINRQEWLLTRDLRTMKETKKELSTERSNSAVLTDDVIKRVAHLAKKVERHFLKSHFIRFCVISNRVYLTGVHELLPPRSQGSAELQSGMQKVASGVSVSQGSATGTLRIAGTADALFSLPADTVLAVKTLSPKLIAHLENIVGIASLHGGLGSELAILARELAKPIVTQSTDFTSLDENDTILLDTQSASLYSVQTPAPPLESHNSFENAFPAPSFLDTEQNMTQPLPAQPSTEPSFVPKPLSPLLATKPTSSALTVGFSSAEGIFLQELIALCTRFGVNMHIATTKKEESKLTPQPQEEQASKNQQFMPFW
ncbi:hypothetical protein COT72_05295 [archaeon CG10_big_fil_rev_8_21_14_0_10_43_11]|nr:MAG: hypothetical protein COT72_05295 [archaeon CG10_big_fil_rev_8_21_14_0_10_43_11]